MRRLAAVVVLSLLCCSCAVMSERNRRLMNYCSRHLMPESTTAQVLTAPVVLPTCLLAGMLDTVVVHPLHVVDDAWYDTRAALWEPTGRGFVTECAVLPVRTLLTPIKFGLQFAARSAFIAKPWPATPAELRRWLLSTDAATRMWALEDFSIETYQGEDVGPVSDVLVEACKAYAGDTGFCVAAIQRIPGPLTSAAADYLVERSLTGRGEVCAVAIWRLMTDTVYWPAGAGGEAEQAEAIKAATNRMAQLYDNLVQAGHREAEVYTASLVARRLWLPGPQALALYILRSLERRQWPDYAAAVAFNMQTTLLDNTDMAKIDAVAREWPALELSRGWVRAVQEAVQRRQKPDQQQLNPEMLTELLRAASAQLRDEQPMSAAELRDRAERLVHIKSLLRADQTAERLLKGPQRDLDLFLGQPLDLLKKKGEGEP